MKKALLLLSAALLAGGLEAEALNIGWATRDITTNDPIKLSGMMYERISQGPLDKLSVTSLVIDGGKDCVIFLSADIIFVLPSLNAEVRREVEKLDPNIPLEKIFFSATHSHSNAGFYWRDQLSLKYHKFFVDQAAAAIVEAWKKRAPGKVAYGYDFATSAFNRRTVYLDDVSKRPDMAGIPGIQCNGHCKMYGSHNDDKFSHVEAIADPFVQFLFTYDMSDKLTGMIVNVPSPAENLNSNYHQSADFCAPLRDMIRKNYGDVFVLSQCSAAGDLAPRYRHMNYDRAQDRRWRLRYGRMPAYREEFDRIEISERVVAALDRTLSWAGKERFDTLPICHVTKTIGLSKFKISEEDCAQARRDLAVLETMQPAAGLTPKELKKWKDNVDSGKGRSNRVLETYERNLTQPRQEIEFHVVRLGDIAFASNPFEFPVDYGKRIQGRSPFVQTFVVQLTSSTTTPTYLPTERAVKNKGYGAIPQSCVVGPEGGVELVEATVAILKELDKVSSPAKKR